MNLRTPAALLLPAMGLFLLSCGEAGNPVSATLSSPDEEGVSVEDVAAGASAKTEATSSAVNPFYGIQVDNYIVTFVDRTYENNSTTFTYHVMGTGAEPELNHFTVELPSCAPEPQAYNPTNSVSINYDPLTDIFGIDWHLSVSIAGDADYSVTFPGNVPLGVARVAIRSGNTHGVEAWYAPCAGELFDVSGAVFVDADADQAFDVDESGLADVTVRLENAEGHFITTKTQEDGSYLFADLLPGTYTLRIPSTTADDDFNDELAVSFDPTTNAPLSVTVGPDAPDNNFGFDPLTQKIITELDTGVLTTNAETVGFWVKEVRAARNGSPRADPALQGYLDAIESLFLSEPFQFADAHEFQAALDVLKNKSKAPIDKLKKELLAAELNQVSGKGISGGADENLLLALIAWGESVVAANQPAAPAAKNGGAGAATASSHVVDEALVLFETLNASGGGGTGGGNE